MATAREEAEAAAMHAVYGSTAAGPSFRSRLSSSQHKVATSLDATSSLVEVATVRTGEDAVGNTSDVQQAKRQLERQFEPEPTKDVTPSGSAAAAARATATAATQSAAVEAMTSKRGGADHEGRSWSNGGGSLSWTAAETVAGGKERDDASGKVPAPARAAVPAPAGAAAPAPAAGWLEYTVKERDTIRSIAARFDVTPSLLKKFNKMSLDFVYPGQVIVIPQGPDDMLGVSAVGFATAAAAAAAAGAAARKSATKVPMETAMLPVTVALSESDEAALDEQCLEMFVKVSACHVTDSHGAVSGTLLVTPNGLMFDPDLSCDADQDSGIARESVLTTMNMISSATVYRDASHTAAASTSVREHSLPPAKRHPLAEPCEEIASGVLLGERADLALASATPGMLSHAVASLTCTSAASAAESADSGSPSKTATAERLAAPGSPDRQNGWRESAPGAAEAERPEIADASQALESCGGAVAPSVAKTAAAAEAGDPAGADLHSPMPKAWAHCDATSASAPAMPCSGSAARLEPASETLYLCLRASVAADNSSSFAADNELYNQRKKPEHWFAVTDSAKLENIYSFLLKWKPDTGECHHNFDCLSSLAPNVPSSTPAWQQPLLEVVLNTGSLKSPQKRHFIMQKQWEVTSSAEVRVTSTLMDAEKDLPLPATNVPSAFLTDAQRRHLAQALPYRIEGNEWRLVYSTELHGFSLSQLYLRMRSLEDSPILLVLQDTSGAVFGALTSCLLAVSDHFYGTGESFLFTFADRFRVYPWTGENNLFIRSSLDNLWIGTGKGTFGLYLDGDLCRGRTQHCKTYNNDPLTGAGEDFVLRHLEAWCFFS